MSVAESSRFLEGVERCDGKRRGGEARKEAGTAEARSETGEAGPETGEVGSWCRECWESERREGTIEDGGDEVGELRCELSSTRSCSVVRSDAERTATMAPDSLGNSCMATPRRRAMWSAWRTERRPPAAHAESSPREWPRVTVGARW